jgi:ferredoxin
VTERYDVELVLPDGATARLEVSADESVWDAATRAGIKPPSMCLQGWCTTCAGRVLEGELDPAEGAALLPAGQAGRLHPAVHRPPVQSDAHPDAPARRHARAPPPPRPADSTWLTSAGFGADEVSYSK